MLLDTYETPLLCFNVVFGARQTLPLWMLYETELSNVVSLFFTFAFYRKYKSMSVWNNEWGNNDIFWV